MAQMGHREGEEMKHSVARNWLITGLAVIALLSGCSGGVDSQPTEEPTVGETLSPSAPAPSTDTEEPPATAECVTADSELTVRLDLTEGQGLVAEFTFLDESIPAGSNFGIHVTAANYGPDGNGPAFIATAKWIGEGVADLSIFDLGTAQNRSLSGMAVVDGSTAIARFDSKPFTELGDGWQWSAAVSVDGEDTYSCPGGTGALLAYPS